MINLDAYAGPAAGLATSVLWSFTTLFFTAASRRLGATKVNALRILLAMCWLTLLHRLLSGVWVPAASHHQLVLLALSGLVGLSLGDWALFTAYVSIGPRLTALLSTTAPIFAALFAWLTLGETLSGLSWLGMVVTIAGVAWVVFERPARGAYVMPARWGSGVILAVLAAACQAGGYLLSKAGMGHGWLPEAARMAPLDATLIRMVFAAVFVLPMLLWLAARRRTGPPPGMIQTDRAARRAGYLFMVGGSIVGPTLGIWMSLIAADKAPLAVAQTLCSLSPVFILPLVMWIHRERVSVRAALGALIAVGGVVLLSLAATHGGRP